jgi:hypothetical protein
MLLTLNHDPIIHVRMDGRSFEVPLHQVLLDEFAGDAEVKRGIATFLGISERRLGEYVVDRDEVGNLTIRPRGFHD